MMNHFRVVMNSTTIIGCTDARPLAIIRFGPLVSKFGHSIPVPAVACGGHAAWQPDCETGYASHLPVS
ncbi:hypothetical protein Pla8534_46690 [Lignipirellula cremea]|uniref:Uncharacterized protein n=1 Tax=Lignipirellula cremea TaxID=2528010 RepID=A0A518DYC7_9BACT|nr:hypothetical protein Pla8534_46690 [Lignipirellula cremea]